MIESKFTIFHQLVNFLSLHTHPSAAEPVDLRRRHLGHNQHPPVRCRHRCVALTRFCSGTLATPCLVSSPTARPLLSAKWPRFQSACVPHVAVHSLSTDISLRLVSNQAISCRVRCRFMLVLSSALRSNVRWLLIFEAFVRSSLSRSSHFAFDCLVHYADCPGWGMYTMTSFTYSGSSWSVSSNSATYSAANFTWQDQASYNRHAIGSASISTLGLLRFSSSSSSMVWPSGSIPAAFTLFAVARQTPGGLSRRIFQAPSPLNFILGWWSGYQGVFYFGDTVGWIATSAVASLNVITCFDF